MNTPFHLEATDRSVHFWTDTRLPFEPKGSMLDARNSVRVAIASMTPCTNGILNAAYRSVATGFCDVENVLFYNVGAAPFRSTVRNGLRFERIYAEPPVSANGRRFNHHHQYCLVEAPPAFARRPDCSFGFSISSLSSSTKPHLVWRAASIASVAHVTEIKGAFEMRVVLELPKPLGNLAAVIKPLLDGIISALHFDPAPDLVAVSRLAAKTDWSTDEILQRLGAPAAPVLGPRRVLQAYREFIKWNPADDLCEACTVLYRPGQLRRCFVELWQRR